MTEESYDAINEKADRLVEGLQEAAKEYGVPLQVNRAGSMLGFFFTDEEVINFEKAQTSDLKWFATYYRLMAEQGIFLPPSQFEGMFLSTEHTMDEIEQTIEAARNAFKKYNK